MKNKQQRVLLILIVAVLAIAGIWFLVRGRGENAGADSGTLAFTTAAAETRNSSGTETEAVTEAAEPPSREEETASEGSSTSEEPETEDAGDDESGADSSPAPEEETTEAATTEEGTEESTEAPPEDDGSVTENGITVTEDGEYTDKDHVALYIHAYGHLPSNYITKNDAEDLGWVSSWGNLWEVAPGMSIGGSRFGNYENLLPTAKGRKYFECDIDYGGKKRNAKRIVYSNDGLIFYTDDHYESFEQLY